MAVFQILVKDLEGRTRCLRFASPHIVCEDVKAKLISRGKIETSLLRLVSGTREYRSGSSLHADASGLFPSCSLLLRLPGGKGGFGSLLRGAATKAGQKKTSNFDACRDMSGRRLRHVNAEKKLKEWKAEAKERELEKTAEEFLRKRKKVEEDKAAVEVNLEESRDASRRAREQIASAVTDALAAEEGYLAHKKSKRKKIECLKEEETIIATGGDCEKKLRPRFHWDSVEESDSEGENEQRMEDSECGSSGVYYNQQSLADETMSISLSLDHLGRQSCVKSDFGSADLLAGRSSESGIFVA